MSTIGFLVDADKLPPSDIPPPLEEARIQYVVRTIDDCGLVKHALSNPSGESYIGPAMETLPNLWDAERIYCNAVANALSSSENQVPVTSLIKQEDAARIEEFERYAKYCQMRLRKRRVKRAARSIKLPPALNQSPDCLVVKNSISRRTHLALTAERLALQDALAA